MNFASDVTAGAHPKVLEALIQANDGRVMPYGRDPVTEGAKERLREIFERDAEIFLVASGTAANGLALSALTPPYGAVVCHHHSHVNEHECAGPELFTGGAKMLDLASPTGRLDPAAIEAAVLEGRGDEHYAQVHAVSITQLAENGTAYTVERIFQIGEVCRRHGLGLHMDGARFANALVGLDCSPAEMTWKAGVDVLSFGATKNGALACEAVVFFDRARARDFLFRQKRAGHVLSKGRFLGAQMAAYLADGLWLDNARRANAMARRLADGLRPLPGVEVTCAVDGNEIFPRLPAAMIAGLQRAGFLFYERGGGLIRLVCPFTTTEAEVDAFIEAAAGLA